MTPLGTSYSSYAQATQQLQVYQNERRLVGGTLEDRGNLKGRDLERLDEPLELCIAMLCGFSVDDFEVTLLQAGGQKKDQKWPEEA